MSKPFDFNHPDFKQNNCPARQQYLLENYNKPITEAEFVKAVQAMPKHLHWSKSHQPNAARRLYRKLVSKYGLFTASLVGGGE